MASDCFAFSPKTRLDELRTPEIFVVLVIRLRVAADRDPIGPCADWREGMVATGIGTEGADAFDMFMHLLDVIAHWPLDVRNLHCAGLGAGEAWLLQAISLLQHDRFDEAETLLARWLPPDVSRIAAKHMQRFARALSKTDLVVPLRHCEARNRASALVH